MRPTVSQIRNTALLLTSRFVLLYIGHRKTEHFELPQPENYIQPMVIDVLEQVKDNQ
jgi:hypothetical protein